MTVIAGIMAPHPPLLIKEIGGGHSDRVSATASALRKLGGLVKDAETLVFISPHSPIIEGGFGIRSESELIGTFGKFGHSEMRYELENDREMVGKLVDGCAKKGVPLVEYDGSRSNLELDWGVLVPYLYLAGDQQVVTLSFSFGPYGDHWRLGEVIAETLESCDKKVVFVASGDLSHRLATESPYGFSAKGSEFDELVVESFKSGQLGGLCSLDIDFIESAGECGLRSVMALGGLASKAGFTTKALSYEGPFGVGYLVGSAFPAGGGGRV